MHIGFASYVGTSQCETGRNELSLSFYQLKNTFFSVKIDNLKTYAVDFNFYFLTETFAQYECLQQRRLLCCLQDKKKSNEHTHTHIPYIFIYILIEMCSWYCRTGYEETLRGQRFTLAQKVTDSLVIMGIQISGTSNTCLGTQRHLPPAVP